VSISQVIFTPIVVFIKKIRPHPTSPYVQLSDIEEETSVTMG
jgi:hypothetical protein